MMFGIKMTVMVNGYPFTVVYPKRRFEDLWFTRKYAHRMLFCIADKHTYKVFINTLNVRKNDNVSIMQFYSKFKEALPEEYKYFSEEEIELLFWRCFDKYSKIYGIHKGDLYVVAQTYYI